MPTEDRDEQLMRRSAPISRIKVGLAIVGVAGFQAFTPVGITDIFSKFIIAPGPYIPTICGARIVPMDFTLPIYKHPQRNFCFHIPHGTRCGEQGFDPGISFLIGGTHYRPFQRYRL